MIEYDKLPAQYDTKHLVLRIILGLMLFSQLTIHTSTAATQTDLLQHEYCEESVQRTLVTAQCGTLEVSENPNASSAANRITLNILRIPALGHTPSAPLFVIAGGPGQASTTLAKQIRYQFSRIHQNHDLVFVDQRGTGQSAPLNCDLTSIDTSLSFQGQQRQQINKLNECIKSYSADLNYYSTPYAVKDLESVRQALGYPKVNLWGASYGTRVILEYLRSYPQSVSRAVLDGVAPYEIELPRHVQTDTSLALTQIFSLCKEHAACSKAFPNLKVRWLNLVKRLQNDPINVTLSHPRTQEPQQLQIDHQVLSAWIRLGLYVRDLAPLIPLAMHAAIENDFTILYSFSTLTEKLGKQISAGMQASVICMEDQQYGRYFKRETQSTEPLVFLTELQGIQETCLHVPKGVLQEKDFAPIESNTPTLILSGKLDPATPPYWAERVKKHLPNSQHIIVPGGHHGVSGMGCMPDIINQFIRSKSFEALQTECINNIKPKPFFIDYSGPALLPPKSEKQVND